MDNLSLLTIKEIATANEFLYKNPEGGKSYLDNYNWLYVRTQLFRKFFGEWLDIGTNKLTKIEDQSKVIDSNGEPLVVSEFKKDGLVNSHYTDNNNLTSSKYFLNARNIIELKNCDWHYNLFNQIVIRLYNLTMHDLLNLMDRYEIVDEEIKKSIIWLYDNENKYSDGKKLSEFLKNKILYKRVFEGSKSIKVFLKLFAKFITGDNSLKNEVIDGFKNILHVDAIKYLDTPIGKYYYIIFSNKDRKKIIEDPRHINNFNNWFVLNK